MCKCAASLQSLNAVQAKNQVCVCSPKYTESEFTIMALLFRIKFRCQCLPPSSIHILTYLCASLLPLPAGQPELPPPIGDRRRKVKKQHFLKMLGRDIQKFK
jgi:hypothetical protein